MLKLAPAAQDFSICLRCQYRLTFRQGPRPGRRRPAGNPHQLRRLTSGLGLRQQQLSPSHDASIDNDDLERAPIRYAYSYEARQEARQEVRQEARRQQLPSSHDVSIDNDDLERAPIRYFFRPEARHPDQDYGQGNGPPTMDSLGLNVLGEPAEFIILRESEIPFQYPSKLARVRASGPDQNPDQGPIGSSEMLEEMHAERGIIDIDEVCKNIESVRASWAAKTRGRVTRVAYKDLFSRVQEGFTKPQLGAYFNRAGKDPAADVFDLNVEFSNSLYARSSWELIGDDPLRKSKAPRIADPNEKEVPGKEHGQGLNKDTWVKRILRHRWNISPKSQDTSLGELDIRLQKVHLDLMLKHKRNILKLISKSYDSKVEAWPQDRVIRITSDYDSCVDISKLFVQTLENIQVSTIDVQKLTPFSRKLDDVILQQIEEYTNTVVRPHGFSRKEFHVFYLGPDDADLLETRRVIDQILRPASAQDIGLAWPNSRKPSNASPAPVVVGSRMPLMDRNQRWSRWCSPQAENIGRGKENKSRFQFMPTIRAFFIGPDDTSSKLCNDSMPHWLPEIEYHDSVKLGQVLFPADTAGMIADRLGRNRKKNMKQNTSRPVSTRDIGLESLGIPREFLSLVPGLVRSLESFGSLEKSEDFCQIRLAPSSKNMSLPVPVEALPDLEIRMFLDEEEGKAYIKDVRLVNGKEKDFLQPRSVVDLRFTRKKCVYARDDSVDPRITSFVRDSNFDIWGTERLGTPPGLSLSIPALAIQPHEGFDPTSHETFLVDYTSLGLEQTSSLTMAYQEPESWPTLTYTSVEAGRIGGRRDELSLHNLRFAPRQLPQSDPAASAVSISRKSLSDDKHSSTLSRKVAALVETIEQAGEATNDARRNALQYTRWVATNSQTTRRVGPVKPWNRPGQVPPANGTIRRVLADYLARPSVDNWREVDKGFNVNV